MDIKRIIINGCSFVHGFDLCYERHGIHPYARWDAALNQMSDEQMIEFESQRLSGRLKNIFNCQVDDLSYSGECNDYIANRTINHINQNIDNIDPETTLVIIGWTEPQRLPFYFPDQKLNVCISLVESYINVVKRETPRTAEAEERELRYKKFLPLQKIWDEYDTMSYTTYFRHLSLAFMLEQYLENKNIRYCFFNSLRTWPLKHNYIQKLGPHADNYDNLVNWNNWFPNKNITSYDWNWDEDMSKKSSSKTATYHPSLESVTDFSKILSEFIIKNY